MTPSQNQARLLVRGRVCLFGEHSDWAADLGLHAGFCLVVGTDQAIGGRAKRADFFRVAIRPGPVSPLHARQVQCPWAERDLQAAAQDAGEFFRYCAGTAHEMMTLPGVTGGLDLEIDQADLPLGKGVASSAAVCILVAQAFDAAYGLKLFPHELMQLAYRGERITGSQCGRMDQACIYGKIPVLLSFERDAAVRVDPIQVGGVIEMFFVDLGGSKDTVAILGDLRRAYLHSTGMKRALGGDNEAIVRQAIGVLRAGDAAALGELMTGAQRMFDEQVAPHSPEQLAGPLLHRLLTWPGLARHVYGGKGVGSQG
ncbi:MAG: GHMP kinase, partial [Planctomycetota bacterium]|nr:GHMP kinase [Planctomycetota bacterium]